ncbi:LysM peptidoglycan-binding domain-containing protein [Salipiger sp. P9]|uniref:LysM peptidoglycan-binding domain-containing protein n=1 Tax=Salipiger pentaromativorans TaxID=2943193 RepID=UPI002157610E|nr:LysM peptidoglycan-binding domain-containing protein [Salipiger pentaromativorans]MCR8549051.1 LysM peptidoglycan-binding domain-containing protein [Salipiger pentaromativorans]
MIRMVLLGIGFLAITIALIAFQPGARRNALPDPRDGTVTRADPALAALPEPDLRPATAPEPVPVAVAPAPKPVAAPVRQAELDDSALRKMTWQTLSNLNSATGHDTAPGQPGSLLHTIVKRSLSETGTDAAAPQPDTATEPKATLPELYVVQAGDSLVSIAQALYGDVNMTGPLFAANQALLARPDDLRPGQTLILPSR